MKKQKRVRILYIIYIVFSNIPSLLNKLLDKKQETLRIKTETLKIIILIRFRFVFVGTFLKDIKTRIALLYLSNLSIAMCNYNLNFDEMNNFVRNYANKTLSSKKQKTLNNDELNSISREILRNDSIVFSKHDFANIQLFSNLFIGPLTAHIEKVMTELMRSEEMNLNYIKFKNLYVIDLSTENIIFDYLEAKNVTKTRKYYKQEKIWQEILYHSQGMKSSYIQENGNNFNLFDDSFRVSNIYFKHFYYCI